MFCVPSKAESCKGNSLLKKITGMPDPGCYRHTILGWKDRTLIEEMKGWLAKPSGFCSFSFLWDLLSNTHADRWAQNMLPSPALHLASWAVSHAVPNSPFFNHSSDNMSQDSLWVRHTFPCEGHRSEHTGPVLDPPLLLFLPLLCFHEITLLVPAPSLPFFAQTCPLSYHDSILPVCCRRPEVHLYANLLFTVCTP